MKLADLYSEEELNDESELLFHFASDEDLASDFHVKTISHAYIMDLVTPDKSTGVLRAYKDFATPEQIDLVRQKISSYDEDRVVIVKGNRVIDGFHHVVASFFKGRDITALDLDEPISPAPFP